MTETTNNFDLEQDDNLINGYDAFNPITGDLCHSECWEADDNIIWLLLAGVGANHLNDEGFWYPCYDWCNRYTGAVLDGEYVDKSNIKQALIEMGWDPNVIHS
jgi:hypothetical protein